MAEVVFLTGVVDVVDFAGRLLRKKLREGVRVAVYGPTPVLHRLDQALWTDGQLDFTPHVLLRAGTELPSTAVVERTALWLLHQPAPASLRCDTGINLGSESDEIAAVHERLAEVVCTTDDEVAAGRARWKRYENLGHSLVHRPQR
jgi:DNA polymerase-3 subunit chi